MSGLRATLGALYRRLPPERRTSLRTRGAWKLALGKLMRPGRGWPVTVGDAQAGRYRVGDDPVDEVVAFDLSSNKRRLYFPTGVDLPEQPLILDIGCHHGFYATAALHHYPRARLIGVEPNPNALPRIRRQLAINRLEDRVRLVHGALAEQRGTGTLKLCARGSWGDSLFEDDAETVGTCDVPLLPLEDILEGASPDIVKCNAEGGEFALAAQLGELALRPTLLIVMVHEEFGSADALVETITALGYRAERLGSTLRPAFHFRRSGA